MRRGKTMSKITTLFKGEYVQVDLVDETIELTVEDNVYSRSESLELLEELQKACAVSNPPLPYSEQMQAELEPIEEPFDDKTDWSKPISGDYKNHLPRLMKEIENRANLKKD
jgi:hypothetical protein